MAEKTKDKSTPKEARKAPIADLAEEVLKEKGKISEENLAEKLDRETKMEDENLEQENEEISEDTEELPKEKVEEVKTEEKKNRKPWEVDPAEILAKWEPKTELGQKVKSGKVKDINEILDKKMRILEPEIIDSLINAESDLVSIGQSKGKFGGGKRRAWRQTQRKTKEGNVPTFSAMAVVGDKNGHVGIGVGKSMETLPARDKATRKAKLNLIHLNRTCAAFDCDCSEKHTVPYEVTGKCSSVKVTLIPAPQGTGLVVADQLKRILELAGIKDVYSKTFGKKRTSFNLAKACIEALKKTNEVYSK